MLYGLPNRSFTKEDEKTLYAELDSFSSVEDVHLTEVSKGVLDVIISIVLTKARWLDPEGREVEAQDMVQEVYLISSTILKNVWKRRKFGPEINSLFSYLFRAIKNRIINYRVDQDRGLIFVEDLQEAVEFWEETSQLETASPYVAIHTNELVGYFEKMIREFRFRLSYSIKDRSLLAAYWLRERFLQSGSISLLDLFWFDDIPETKKEFIFDYVDVCLKRLVVDFRKKYGDKQTRCVFSRFSITHDLEYESNTPFGFRLSPLP